MRKHTSVLIIILIILSGCVTYKDGEPVKDKAYEKRQEEKQVKEEEQKEAKGEREAEKEVEHYDESKERTIDVKKEVELNGVNVEIQTISIKDNKVTVPIWWSHWTNYDKAHLSLLLIPTLYQGDNSLEMTNGEDTLIRQKEKGVEDRAVLEFELQDDKTPLDVRFIETTDEAKEKSITINID